MFRRKNKITQEDCDRAIGNAYRLGYQVGQIEERNRQWISKGDGLTLIEKQILIILEKEGF